MRTWIRPFSAGCVLVALAACTSLAERIAKPRTEISFASRMSTLEMAKGISNARITARNGNTIAYAIVPAADFQEIPHYSRVDTPERFSITFSADYSAKPSPVPVRGAIVYLHGLNLDHASMLYWATFMAKSGFVGILPDLRNHGASDRAPAGYGTREAEDVVDLVDALQKRGDIHGPVYLFGISYGAATAAFAAQQTPERFAGVIAMEPFSNASDAIRTTIDEAKTLRTSGFRNRVARSYLRHTADTTAIDRAIAEAGAELDLDLDHVDVTAALRATRVCTALVLSGHDTLFGPAAQRAVQDAPQVRQQVLPDENHVTLGMRADLLAKPLTDWLSDVASCPPLHLPTSPAGHP